MTGRDEYYNRAKQEGYRSRAAYKLKQLDETANLISEGDTVVDLGAAPGGWSQVAAELAGDLGTVVAVDRQRIDAIDGVETVRGDMTEESTQGEVLERVGEADQGEASDVASGDAGTASGEADLVVSDMAPNMTGEYELDHARSVHLARTAFETALELLAPGGDFVAKVFEGPDTDDLRADIDEEFEYVRSVHPEASRDSSSELFLVGKGRLTAPVGAGDRIEVDVVDVGDQGDGIARIGPGYVVFVPETTVGDRVTVEITEARDNFAFGTVREGEPIS